MIIHKAFKYRIYPTKDQQNAFNVQFGHARFVYNWALSKRKEHYKQTGKGLTTFDINKLITSLKRKPDTIWLKKAHAQVLQAKVKDVDTAYKNFFSKRAKYPKFKSKKSKQSIKYPQGFKVKGKHIYAPKVGLIKAVIHRPIEGKMKNMTVSKTKSGKYFVSIQCEIEIDEPIFEGPHIGVDLGLIHLAKLSNGEEIENPRWLRKAEKKLARLERQKSRKVKGSANRQKHVLKIARLHEKVANQRRDFHHKESKKLVDKYGVITFENLNVKGMVKNHRLAKSISDVGWSQFVSFNEYKGQWYGAYTEKIDRFYASSKTCSVCGEINHNLKLSDRFWTCQGCGTYHDRDENAAINIRSQSTVGTTESYACGHCVRLGSDVHPSNDARSRKPPN